MDQKDLVIKQSKCYTFLTQRVHGAVLKGDLEEAREYAGVSIPAERDSVVDAVLALKIDISEKEKDDILYRLRSIVKAVRGKKEAIGVKVAGGNK